MWTVIRTEVEGDTVLSRGSSSTSVKTSSQVLTLVPEDRTTGY